MTSTRWARTSVVGNLKEELAALENEVTLEAGGYRWVLYREGASEYLEAMLASYRSILDRADTWRLRRALRSRSPWLERLCPPPSRKPFWRGQRSFPCFAARPRLLSLKVYRGRRGGACRWSRFPAGRLGWLLQQASEGLIENIVLAGEDGGDAGRILPRRAVAAAFERTGATSTPHVQS